MLTKDCGTDCTVRPQANVVGHRMSADGYVYSLLKRFS